MKDELSGLLNSEEIRDRINLFLKTMPEEMPCAMFLIDIDNFKEVHDILGKKAGEDILRRIGQILTSLFRTTDLVGRIGGDEFLVFLSGDLSQKLVCEKARIICDELKFTEKSENGKQIDITVSVGAGMFFKNEKKFRKLYKRAESALNKAKEAGKQNFYILFEDTFTEERQELEIPTPVNIISLRTLLAYMDDGVALLEIGSRVNLLYASPGFFKMLRIDKKSLNLPCKLDEIGICPEEEKEYEEKLRDQMPKEGVIEHIHRVLTEQGWVWRRVCAVRIAYPLSEYPIVLEISTNISEFMESENQLKESLERLRIAFGQIPHLLWELELPARRFTFYSIDMQQPDKKVSMEHFPESFFEQGMIHPSSFESFRRFANEMIDGKAEGYGNFIMRSRRNNQFGWVSLSYRMIYDPDGVPIKAVGIQEKMSDLSGVHSFSFPRRPLPEVIRHDLIVKLRVNLTTTTIDELWAGGLHRTNLNVLFYPKLIRKWSSFLFYKAEGREFRQTFQRDNLLNAFEQGKKWFSKEYRWVDQGGNIRWMMYTVNLVRNAYTRDIEMFSCFVDVQKRHSWENMLETGAVRDTVSGLYDTRTMKELAECLIRARIGTNCTFVLINPHGVDKLQAENEQTICQIRRFFAVALSFALGADCVLGQYMNNSVIAFFPETTSRFEVKKRMEEAFAYIRMTMDEILKLDDIRFIAGAVTEKTDEANYERMLLRAGYLCEFWKTAAVDTVAFPDMEDEWIYIGLKNELENNTSVLSGITERPLSAEEQNAAFYCVTEMLASSGDAKASVESALRGIGYYYRADRVYMLILSEDEKTVTVSFEWVGQGKHSIRKMMSEVQIERIPLLQRCIKEDAPVSIKRQREAMQKKGSWNFMIYPIKQNDAKRRFLCVENGQEHSEETALLEQMVPYILQEEEKVGPGRSAEQSERISKADRLLESMPNLHIYMDTIHSMSSDNYSSMGVVSLDIPDFSAINADKGYTYGGKLLSQIAEALDAVFGTAFRFRTWDAEFVVLYPDSILEAFVGRCTRLRSILEQRCPDMFRMGHTWSEDVFSGEHLVREAQSIMRSETIKRKSDIRNLFLSNQESAPVPIVKKSSFVAYFQPKIDMRDGSLVGAEALAREINEDGTLVPPEMFIRNLEKNGKIRELDLYMLEQVLWQLNEWQSRGLPPICVSVNISRHTLTDPNTLASILALQSHYPDVPADRISLEITETAGDIEKATLSSIVERFGEFGICFELDDFGSHYSNMSIFSSVKFSTIKLDKSLICELPNNAISQTLVKDLVNICKDFGMLCIAEGVETRWQKDALLDVGCVYGQGFYYSKPLPPAKFEEQYLKSVKVQHRKGV